MDKQKVARELVAVARELTARLEDGRNVYKHLDKAKRALEALESNAYSRMNNLDPDLDEGLFGIEKNLVDGVEDVREEIDRVLTKFHKLIQSTTESSAYKTWNFVTRK